MSFWNKIVIGSKFLFGGWESALEYLLRFLNEYLNKPEVAKNVEKINDTAAWALGWLAKLRKYVPSKWFNKYDAIVVVLSEILAITEDKLLTVDECKRLTTAFMEAKAKWEQD